MNNREYAERFFALWEAGEQVFTLTTSGSTGDPKPIALYRKYLEWSAHNTEQRLQLKSDESVHCCISVQKAGGFMMLVRSAVLHYPVTVTEAQNDPMAELEENHKLTFVSLVPLQLRAILQNSESLKKLRRFRHVLLGGSSLDTELETAVQKLEPACWHTYGMTETYSHIALKRLNGPQPDAHFILLPDISIRSDERGCLALKAPFTEGSYMQTNDKVIIYPDGSFDLAGRSDFVINSGGVKLQPELIEDYIRKYIRSLSGQLIVVTGIPDNRLGEKAVLAVEGNPAELKQDEWREFSEHIPAYHEPKAVYFFETLPVTESGKADRIKVKELVSLRLQKPE